jgi:excisionase family DNA binding protein
MSAPKVLTVEEVAKWLRISKSSAYEGVRNGAIPHIKIGKRVLVPVVALEAMLRGEKVA